MDILYIGDEDDAAAFKRVAHACVPDAEVYSVGYSERALSALARRPPQLVFLDEEVSGLKIADIREHFSVDVIFTVSEKDVRPSKEAQGHFILPINEKDLVRVLRPMDMLFARHEREKVLLNAVEVSPNGIAILGTNGRFSYVNAAFCQIIGIPQEKILGHYQREVFPEPVYAPIYEQIQNSIASCNEVWSGVITGIRLDNGHAFSAAATLRDCSQMGHPDISTYFVFRDITEELRLQQDLRRLAQVVTQSGDSVVITDTKQRIVYVNASFERVTGYRSVEVIGKTPKILKSGEHPADFYREMWRALHAGRSWCGIFVNRRKNGELYWEDTLITPILNENGNVAFYAATKRDITEQRRLQDEVSKLHGDLEHMQKIESIGRLAGGIAHDFNNMLQGILGFTELIELDAEPDSQLLDNSRKILKIVYSAQKLTRQLLAFGRKQVVNPERLDVNAYLRDLQPMIPRLLGAAVEVPIELESGLPPVFFDHGQFEQVLINLLVNARDAVSQCRDPLIKVTSSLVEFSTEDLESHQMTGHPGPYVAVSVIDNGVGIAPRHLDKIFEPFYTTKTKDRGTGLGLSVVFGIMRQHGGDVTATSKLGEGSIFTLYLPLFRGEPRSGQTATTIIVSDQTDALTAEDFADIPAERNTILLVEDNPLVTLVASRNIHAIGLNIEFALSEASAIEIYEKNKDRICLLFSDIILASGDGVHLAEELRRQNPSLPVLLTSGYSKDSLDARSIHHEHYLFLPKPYNRRTLLQAIRQAIHPV